MPNQSSQLTSKVVLITGARSGIGEATARHLAAKGHQVALGARRAQRISVIAQDIEATGARAFHGETDVTDPDSFNGFVASAHAHYGRVDVLINNARIMPLSFLDELPTEGWNQMI